MQNSCKPALRSRTTSRKNSQEGIQNEIRFTMGKKLQIGSSEQGTGRDNVGNNGIKTYSELKDQPQIARSD
jgi:hypothetical protein